MQNNCSQKDSSVGTDLRGVVYHTAVVAATGTALNKHVGVLYCHIIRQFIYAQNVGSVFGAQMECLAINRNRYMYPPYLCFYPFGIFSLFLSYHKAAILAAKNHCLAHRNLRFQSFLAN